MFLHREATDMIQVCKFMRKIAPRCKVVQTPYILRSSFIPSWKYHGQNFSTGSGTTRGTNRNLPTLIQSWRDRLSRAEVPEAECSVDLIVAHALGKKVVSIKFERGYLILARSFDQCFVAPIC